MHKVSQHYDEASRYDDDDDDGQKDEKQKVIRAFNNWIKIILIGDAAHRLGYAPRRVFDAACGRGGDILKWKHHNIEYYEGVDISAFSIMRAMDRAQNVRLPYEYTFMTFDLSQPMEPPHEPFDLVSIQFALHYFFQSEEALNTFFENIRQRLRPGGIFFGSTVSYSRLKQRLRGRRRYENKFMSISMDYDTHQRFDNDEPAYGLSYTFSLGDRVRSLDEYVVHPELLISKAEQYGFRFVLMQNFDKYFNTYKSYYPRGHYGFVPRRLNREEWATICIYNVFMFQKY